MAWQELADLPFARALAPREASLAAGESYDGAHFDQAELDGADTSGSNFLECAFTGVTLQDHPSGRVQLSDVWLHNTRLLGVSLARTGWRDVTLTGVVMAGVEMFVAGAAAGHLRPVQDGRGQLPRLRPDRRDV